MPSAERSLRHFNVRLHHLILRRRLFHIVFLIGLSSVLAGVAVLVFGDRRLGGAIIAWGAGCAIPVLLFMFVLMWGTASIHLLVARRYGPFALVAFLTAAVGVFFYMTVRVVVRMLFGS